MKATASVLPEQCKVRALLVIDDDHLRRTLPGVFTSQGMEVVVTSTVGEVRSSSSVASSTSYCCVPRS
jgi:hypothetical protein